MNTRGIILRGMETRGLRPARNAWRRAASAPRETAWRRAGPAPRGTHGDARPPPRAEKKAPRLRNEAGGPEGKTGGALLSHAPGRSTIAARALNVRVREGNGCDSPAKATGQKIGNRMRRKEKGRIRRRGAGARPDGASRNTVSCLRPRPRRVCGMAGGGAGKPHGLSEPVC